jgi:hypothetical protein
MAALCTWVLCSIHVPVFSGGIRSHLIGPLKGLCHEMNFFKAYDNKVLSVHALMDLQFLDLS